MQEQKASQAQEQVRARARPDADTTHGTDANAAGLPPAQQLVCPAVLDVPPTSNSGSHATETSAPNVRQSSSNGCVVSPTQQPNATSVQQMPVTQNIMSAQQKHKQVESSDSDSDMPLATLKSQIASQISPSSPTGTETTSDPITAQRKRSPLPAHIPDLKQPKLNNNAGWQGKLEPLTATQLPETHLSRYLQVRIYCL